MKATNPKADINKNIIKNRNKSLFSTPNQSHIDFCCQQAKLCDFTKVPEIVAYPTPYGFTTKRKANPLEIELVGFNLNWPPSKGGLGRAGHGRKICEILWGEKHQEIWKKKPPKELRFNPWTERSFEYAAKYNYLSVLGCANSTKTTSFAAWAIVNWLADPLRTKVFVTSTSLKDSRKRIWGRVCEYFTVHKGLPGKLVDSIGAIRTIKEDGTVAPDTCGIEMIAGERKKEREAIGKMIGFKAPKVIVIADELPELSPAILDACFSNLASNDYFQLIGIGNFASILDPLGTLSEPKEGWKSICPEDEEWETKYGWCIRFDGLKSQNIIQGEDVYPEIYTNKLLKQHRANLGGENSSLFWRMCRSFPCPDSAANIIYGDSDFIKGQSFDAPVWASVKIPIASADPSFSVVGDKFVVSLGWVGDNLMGEKQVAFNKQVELHEDMRIKDKPRDFQLAEQLIALCKEHGVEPENLGIDASGPGGLAFFSIVSSLWSSKCLAVKFAGKGSQSTISLDDDRTGEEAYYNRRSEIWFGVRDPLRNGLVRGLPEQMAREMKGVEFTTHKHGSNLIVKVEPKEDTKKRLGFSPDYADSGFIMIDVARQRHKFQTVFRGDSSQPQKNGTFDGLVKEADLVYANADYSDGIEEFV